MERLITTAALIAMAPLAGWAGGLANPIDESPRPISRTSSTSSSDWTGFYGGLMAGVSRWETERQEHVGDMWACKFGDYHRLRKCTPHGDSPDVQELEYVERPWQHPDYKGAFDGDPVAYDDNPIIWGSPGSTFEYFLPYGSAPNNPIQGKDAEISYLAPVIETFVDEHSEAAFGAFVGGRYDFGTVVVGAEAWGMQGDNHDIWAVEAQAGYDLGGALPYFGVISSDEGSLGIDWRVSDSVIMGLKVSRVGDVEVASARIGWAF